MKTQAAHWPLRRRVEVEWVDSAHNRGWDKLEDKRKRQDVALVRTIGYLLSTDRKRVRLVMSQSEPDDVGDGMSIPRGCILRVKPVRGGLR